MRVSVTLLAWLTLIVAGPTVVEADTKYWDIDTISQPGAGGTAPSGTWDTGTTANWNTSASGTGVPTTWSAGDSAVFAAGSNATGTYSVTVSGIQSLAGLAVEEGTVSQSGGTLNFGATANTPIDIAAGATWSQANFGTFNGTGGLIKSGGGTLTLRGSNTFSKSGSGSQAYLTINDGIVDFFNDSQLGAAPATTDNGAALTIDGGTLRYSDVSGSALTLAPNRGVRFGPNGGTIEVTNAATLALSASAPTAAALNGSGTITKTGIGRFELLKEQTSFTGKYIVKNGSLSFARDGVFGALPPNVPDYFTLDGGGLRVSVPTGPSIDLNRGITLGPNGGTLYGRIEGFSYSGVISGTQGGGLKIALHDVLPDSDTFGSVRLFGVSTYDGPTQIETGMVLSVGSQLANGGMNSAIGKSSNAASNLILNGGTLQYRGTAGTSTDRNFTLTAAGGGISAPGTGSATLAFTSTAPITLTGTGPRTFTLSGGSTGDNIMSLAITDQGPNPTTLSKSSTGTWVLTNPNNSYTGNTAVTLGTLKLGAAGVIPNESLVTSMKGATLDLNGFDETVRSISGSLGGGTIALGSKTLTLDNPNGETCAVTITGAGGKLIKNGAGKFTLSTLNSTFDGGVILNAGVFGFGSDNPFGVGPLVVNNNPKLANAISGTRASTNAVTLNGDVTFDDSFTPAPGAIIWNTNGANQWTIAGSDRTIGVNSAAGGSAVTINQVIGQDAPGRGLTKAGNGTLTFGAANTYTGNTTVQGGILSIANPYLADSSDVYLTTGSTFNLTFPAASPDVIDSLFIDGVPQATGTWGAVGSGADHEINWITGTGRLQVSTFVPGDFNNDGQVGAEDYVLWQKNNGTDNKLPNDNGLSTPIGQSHYTLWRNNFGKPPGAGSGDGLGGAPVPEPAAMLLGTLALIGFLLSPRRRVASH